MSGLFRCFVSRQYDWSYSVHGGVVEEQLSEAAQILDEILTETVSLKRSFLAIDVAYRK